MRNHNYGKSFESQVYEIITSTLCNIIKCCPGFEDMKDEVSSSLEASDTFGLIFY